MHKDSNKPEKELSRRSLLRGAAVASAAAVPVILAGAHPAASAKIAQSGVGYQDTPKGSANCANCKLFEPPSACKTVDGTISPNGWCKIWVKA